MGQRSTARTRKCKECPRGTRRKAPYPGPRCFTHHKAKKNIQSQARKTVHILVNFTLSEDEYQALLTAQGGGCYICNRKPGRRRLAVDHNHKSPCILDPGGHDPKKGCKMCIRGLLCTRCNKYLGHVRDEPEAGSRIYQYLTNPPANRVLN